MNMYNSQFSILNFALIMQARASPLRSRAENRTDFPPYHVQKKVESSSRSKITFAIVIIVDKQFNFKD